MKMMTFSPPPLWELRNFIRIFGEPASSTDICFIQIQLTIGLTKLLKAWRWFQRFLFCHAVVVAMDGGGGGWWVVAIVVVVFVCFGFGRCPVHIDVIRKSNQSWQFFTTITITIYSNVHRANIWGKINNLSKLEISQVFQNKRTYWKKTTHLWEYVANPEIQKKPGQFLIKYEGFAI